MRKFNLVEDFESRFSLLRVKGDLKLANHKTRCRFETIKISNFFWRHVTCCLPGSSPSRHFERREDPGDEVAKGGSTRYQRFYLGCTALN